MSKIGKQPVILPDKVEVKIDSKKMDVIGEKGTLSNVLPEEVQVEIVDRTILVKPMHNSKKAKAMWGLSRSLINNMVLGVSKGFSKKLEINGVGYRASKSDDVLFLSLGYSHDIAYSIPKGIDINCLKPTLIEISGIDKQLVGQVSAEIRNFRKPEPYKGKGVKYEGEYILRKEGKKK